MSLIIMASENLLSREETPPSRSRSLSAALSLPLSRMRKSSRSESRSRPSSRSEKFLRPPVFNRSSEEASDSANRSGKSRKNGSFREMVNRLRSSSNVSLVSDLLLQESDFKQIEDWFTAFDRYNQLVTTRISPARSYPNENFTKLTKILSKNCGGRFIHSLPEAVFDLALLWCPAEPMTRSELQEPTWSWTGWEGAVNFPFDPTNCPDILSLPRREGEWFRSEILHYHVGPSSTPYTVRREKRERNLRIHYPPYFHAPWGDDANAESDTLRFSAYTISANSFTAEQLEYNGRNLPCSQLIDDNGKQCGVIMDYEESISAASPTGPFEFVLISRNLRREPAKNTRRPVVPTIHPPGTPIWRGERFLWDEEVVEYDEEIFTSGPWKVLNVMLIKWVGEHAERVAVGRIHQDAWNTLSPTKKDIVLR